MVEIYSDSLNQNKNGAARKGTATKLFAILFYLYISQNIHQGRSINSMLNLLALIHYQSFYIHFHFIKWYEGIIHKQSCNVSMFRWYSSVLHGIRLELGRMAPSTAIECLFYFPLRLVILGDYAVFESELHSYGPFINHEATLNKFQR